MSNSKEMLMHLGALAALADPSENSIEEKIARAKEDEEIEMGLRPPRPYTRTRNKIGRNEPCHCGSGLKYKKCHG